MVSKPKLQRRKNEPRQPHNPLPHLPHSQRLPQQANLKILLRPPQHIRQTRRVEGAQHLALGPLVEAHGPAQHHRRAVVHAAPVRHRHVDGRLLAPQVAVAAVHAAAPRRLAAAVHGRPALAQALVDDVGVLVPVAVVDAVVVPARFGADVGGVDRPGAVLAEDR